MLRHQLDMTNICSGTSKRRSGSTKGCPIRPPRWVMELRRFNCTIWGTGKMYSSPFVFVSPPFARLTARWWMAVYREMLPSKDPNPGRPRFSPFSPSPGPSTLSDSLTLCTPESEAMRGGPRFSEGNLDLRGYSLAPSLSPTQWGVHKLPPTPTWPDLCCFIPAPGEFSYNKL